MRRLSSLALLIVATLAAGRLLGQDIRPTLTVTGASDTPVTLEHNNTSVVLGRTNASGQLSYDPSLLSGKPMMDLHIAKCPKDTAHKVTLSLFPRPADGKPEDHTCPPGCDCPCKKAAFVWTNSYTTSISGSPGFPSLGNPITWALIGAGAGGGVLAATSGGGNSSGSNNSNNQPSVPVATFDADLAGLWQLGGTVQTQNNCQPVNYSTTITFGGTMQATTATLTQFIANRNQALNYTGTTTQQGNTFQISLTSTGTLIGLGTYNSTVAIQTNQKTATGNQTITTNACPFSWSLALSR